MNCHDARLLIDERVHGTLAGELAANLEEHLRDCADCRDDLRQLQRVRELLTLAKTDAPPRGELTSIWKNIARAASPESDESVATDETTEPTARKADQRARRNAAMNAAAAAHIRTATQIDSPQRRRWKFMITSMTGIAALLIVSFAVGQMTMVRHRSVAADMAPEGNMRGYFRQDGLAERDVMVRTETLATDHDTPPSGAAINSLEDMAGAGGSGKALGSGGGNGEGDHLMGRREAIVVPPDILSRAELGDHFESVKPDSPETQRAFGNAEPAKLGKATELSADSQLHRLNLNFKEQGENKPATGQAAPAEEKNQPRANEASVNKPKIIKTGELTVEVKNFVEASRGAETLIVRLGGFVADSRTFDLPGAAKRGEIVIRIVPEKFEELFSELKKLGVVLHERAGGQDITAQYTDTEARIKNLQIAEERLQELIRSKSFIDKITSLLEVERELSRVRGEIEGMQGQMRVWKDQLALSTIRVTLQEPSRPVPSGSISVEVGSLSDAKKALDTALAAANAQLVTGQTSKRNDGTLSGNYTLRVKYGRFAELLAAIKNLGRVPDERIQNQPFQQGVPEGAQDVPCELALVLFERAIALPGATINMEVSALPETLTKLNAAMSEVQAAIVSNETQRQSDGTSVASMTLRVRAGNFTKLLDALPALGRTLYRTVTGEAGNVQGGAADMLSTINLTLAEQRKQVPSGTMGVEVAAFTTARDNLSKMIKENGLQVLSSNSQQREDGTWAGWFKLGIKADKMDAAVSQIEALGRVKRRELQGLGLGDLSRVDPNVIGEVTIALEERPAIGPQEDNAFRLLLRDTFGGFLNSMGIVVRGLALLLPWLLLGAAVVWPLWRWSKKKAAAEVKTKTTDTPEPPAA